MIYECPNCHAPQEAGRTACSECGAEFDGPVPDDAIVPSPPAFGTAAAPEAVLDTPHTDVAGAGVISEEAATIPEEAAAADALPEAAALSAAGAAAAEPVLETVRPPAPAPELPYQENSYQENSYQQTSYQAPAYSPPPAYAPPPGGAQAYTPRKSPASPLLKALLIALPFVLLLVLVGYLVSRNLDGGADATVSALPVTAPVPPRPAPAPIGSPTVLVGGTSAGSDDSRVKWLAGRWQASSTDFYVFNPNGSGSQGSVTGKLPTQDFLWRIVGNQLMLYGAPKDQEVRFTIGPDDNTVYLRGSAGNPAQYTRQAEAAKQ